MCAARLLLVEDSRSVAQYIIRILSPAGYDITWAEDGLAAWELLEGGTTGFETIVLDREMPRMNGLELLKRLKSVPHLNQIPVVMATSLRDEKSVREGLEAGAYYYLTKPFVPDVLVSVVKAALDQFHQYQELKESVHGAERSFTLLESGIFRFRTVDDGRLLSKSIAHACPDPEKTVPGLMELLLNAVEHGNLGIGYDEKSALVSNGEWLQEINRRLESPEWRGKQVTVRVEKSPTAITITIIDQGNGFDWKKYVEFDAQRAFDNHGRGIAMACMLSFDTVQYQGKGNIVMVTIKLPRAVS